MARARLSTFLLIPLIPLAGCSGFFGFNAFSTLDTVTAPSASRYEGSGGLALLAEDLSSPAVVAALTADTTTTQQIETYLYDNYLTGTLTTADQKQAAILYADLNLKTTDGEDLVNNIVTTVMSGTSGNIHDLLGSVLPSTARADSAAFSTMINALMDSNAAYQKLGASITDVNGNGVIDAGEGVPTGTNMGDVAQKAAVAFTIEIVFLEAKAAYVASFPSATDADVIQQLYLLATAPSTADSSVTGLTVSPFTVDGTYVTSSNFGNLRNIVECAGLELTSSGITTK